MVGGDDELDGAGTGVVDAASGVAGSLADTRSGLRVEQWGRRFFDDLLMASLQAAFTLTEVDDVAVTVGEDLHLDVPGPQHESLEEQRVVAERGGRLAAGTGQRGRQILGALDQTHALAAATCGRFDQDREADVGGTGDQVLVGQSRSGDAGYNRDTEGADRGLGGDLVAHHLDGLLRRSEEGDSGFDAGRSEVGVLREESVAGVNSLCAGGFRGGDHLVDVEVALACAGGAESYRGIGLADVPGVGVRIAVDGDGPNAHAAQRSSDAYRDLTAVGDQNGVQHRGHLSHIRKTP